eukprot:GHVR01149616.1.p1 GENE.GHVR01149616.1~~GHVR01149616.1.p1  ORF type:complete len:649 (+),score=103.27 GHVR01149616.1:260-1948(+)
MSSTLTVSGLTYVNSSNGSGVALTVGGEGGSGLKQQFILASGQYNWQIGAATHVTNTFSIVPSTASEGTSFANPAINISQNGNIVFNENGVDADFRVESDANTHMLFVDASADSGAGQVVIGSTNPIEGIGAALTVNGLADTRIAIDGANSSGIYMSDSGAEGITIRNALGDLEVYGVAGHELIFNKAGIDLDFRIEGNARANLFVVDGGKSMLGIGMPPDQSWGSQSVGINFGIGDADAGAITWQERDGDADHFNIVWNAYNDNTNWKYESANPAGRYYQYAGGHYFQSAASGSADANITFVDVMRLSAVGAVFNEGGVDADFRVESDSLTHALFVNAGTNKVLFGTSEGSTTSFYFDLNGGVDQYAYFANGSSTASSAVMYMNRQGSDGDFIHFRQANVIEGSISVSGATVSYNGFSGRHESSGIPVNTPVGTVVSTIDALDVYPATQADPEGGVEPNPKAGQTRADHAQVEVSTSEGDSCVYGVVSEFDSNGKLIVTSVGIGSIRVTGACSKGDLLESNGDGTAKVQSDDIMRSKTIGKVTIGNGDTGVKLVSCVMYCG